MEFFLTVTNLFEIHNDTLTEIFHLLAHSPLATRTETQGSQETGAPCTHTTFCIRAGRWPLLSVFSFSHRASDCCHIQTLQLEDSWKCNSSHPASALLGETLRRFSNRC